MEQEKEKNQENSQAAENEDFNFYEVSFLLDPRLNEVELGQEVAKIENIIKNCQGQIIEENWPQRMELAYPIKKNAFAYFGWLLFEARPECVKMFPEKVKYELKILRYLTLKRDKKLWEESKNKPKPVRPEMSKKQEIKEQPKKQEEETEIDEEKLEERLEEILK